MRRRRLLLAMALAFLGGLAGCAGDDNGVPQAGNAADRAFLQALLPQRKGLIASARVGAREADQAEVRALRRALDRG